MKKGQFTDIAKPNVLNFDYIWSDDVSFVK